MELLDRNLRDRLERLTVLAKKFGHSSNFGTAKSHRRGYSPEFSDYREYCSGDDPRFIDWNLFGRLDNLYLKLFLAEDDLILRLIIDCSPSMSYKFFTSKQIAAALGYVALASGNRLQFLFCRGVEVTSSQIMRGKSQSGRMLEMLRKLELEGELQPLFLRKKLLRMQNQGINVFLSDLLAPAGTDLLSSVINTIKSASVFCRDFYLVHIMSEQEVNPACQNGQVFVDQETGDEIKLRNRFDLDAYKNVLKEFRDTARQEVVRRGGGYTFVNSGRPVLEAVSALCRGTGLLGR